MSMFKSLKVNYPKKKTKVNDMKVIGVPEPVRKTMYDIVLDNFNIAGRKTYLQRIVYIGEHCFIKYEAMVNFFTETVTKANYSRHTIEKLTGILIKYNRHFIHFLEGDEDAIYEHIRLLFHNEQYSNIIENVKLLTIIHHINCRYASEWTCISGSPPQLLEKIDPSSPVEVAGSVIYGCILKIYDILNKMNKDDISTSDLGTKSTDENLSSIKSPDMRSSVHSTSSCAQRNSLRYIKRAFGSSMKAVMSRSKTSFADPVMINLPEIDTLHFLISTPHTKYLKDVLAHYRNIEQRDIYKDKVWPIAADFIPYDVYSKGFNMSTVFPKPGSKATIETTEDNISMLLWTAEGEDAEYNNSREEIIDEIILFVVIISALAGKLQRNYLPPPAHSISADGAEFLNAPLRSISTSSGFRSARPSLANQFRDSLKPISNQTFRNVETFSSRQQIPIIRLASENNGEGSYRFAYETDNSIVHEEEGHQEAFGLEQGTIVRGSYSYQSPEGQVFTVNYVADGNGFRASGDHLPTSPPIPDEIAKSLSLNYVATQGEMDDAGVYRKNSEVHDLDSVQVGRAVNGVERKRNLDNEVYKY